MNGRRIVHQRASVNGFVIMTSEHARCARRTNRWRYTLIGVRKESTPKWNAFDGESAFIVADNCPKHMHKLFKFVFWINLNQSNADSHQAGRGNKESRLIKWPFIAFIGPHSIAINCVVRISLVLPPSTRTKWRSCTAPSAMYQSVSIKTHENGVNIRKSIERFPFGHFESKQRATVAIINQCTQSNSILVLLLLIRLITWTHHTNDTRARRAHTKFVSIEMKYGPLKLSCR